MNEANERFGKQVTQYLLNSRKRALKRLPRFKNIFADTFEVHHSGSSK